MYIQYVSYVSISVRVLYVTQKITTEWVDHYQFNHILRLVVYLMQGFKFKVAQPAAVIKLQF